MQNESEPVMVKTYADVISEVMAPASGLCPPCRTSERKRMERLKAALESALREIERTIRELQ